MKGDKDSSKIKASNNGQSVTQMFSKAEVRWNVIKSQVRSKLISIVRKTEVFRKTWLRLMVINIQVRSKLVIMVRVSDVVRKTDLRLMVIKTQVRLKLVSMAESLKCSTRLQQDERWLRIMWDQSCSLTEILVTLPIDTSILLLTYWTPQWLCPLY